MTHIEVSHSKSYVRPQRIDPYLLLISVIKQRPKAPKEARIAAFKRMVLPGEFDAHLEKIVDEWISIKYTTACRAAFPPTIATIKQRVKKRASEDGEAEENLIRNIWKFTHACTFQQASKQFTSLGAAIAAVGKGRMNKRIDSVFKSPEEFDAALKKAGHV